MSRATFASSSSALIAAQFEAAPGIEAVRGLRPGFAAADPATVVAIIDEAIRFSERYLAPFNDTSDSQGARLVDGRVFTADGHKEAWAAFVEAGWNTLEQPEIHGGQELPLALATAAQEQFDRGCAAFGMLPVPQRSAARLLAEHANEAIRAEWLPHLVAGTWGATICVSEPGAGSDVDRIVTRAVPNDDGSWAITGQKIWISYGDHDLSPRIGHCLLARTPGDNGLSIFLVPSSLDAEGEVCNGITVNRLEHKLGLHGSPTCALGFENSRGWLIGKQGRGLAQMFTMITSMRLAVGTQGLGLAAGAADTALAYAMDRCQGGAPDQLPVPIIEHADVRRQLLEMHSRVEMLRGIGFATANQMDLSRHHPDEQVRDDAMALAAWLLPLYKTFGGETAFDVASDAIQVLGGAGYTREWPIEQALRDARVFTVYEGTTGIQAIDLVLRRLIRGQRRGLDVFLRMARDDAARSTSAQVAHAETCFNLLEDAAVRLMEAEPEDALAGATAFLHLATWAATAWIACRHLGLSDETAVARRLAAHATYWLGDVHLHARLAHGMVLQKADRLSMIEFALRARD